ncbi:hypothetical protein [Mesorhizobium sp. CN2-181]|uniref:hypothetical protein n=1 Tax=Mesorhizobium yinganensis TaxID=3157707 RepID=UPI0032B7B026
MSGPSSRYTLYGHKGFKRGHVIASLSVSSHGEARILQSMLDREMRERAGKPEEAILADWFNHLENTRRQAVKEKWIGWEDPL